MKKTFMRIIAIGMILLNLNICASATDIQKADANNFGEVEGFTPTSESTWGDVLRYFNPEEFDHLPEELQQQYDAILLEDVNDESTSSTTATLRSGIVVSDLLTFAMGTTGNRTSIDYSISLYSTVQCPYIGISVVLYDAEANTYVASDLGVDTNTQLCTLEDSFTGLIRQHKYRVQAASAVTPPAGYWGDGVLTLEDEVSTK